MSGTIKKDLIIIGGGAAGLTAALYAGRDKLDVVLIEKMIAGGQAATTDEIENYPGFPNGVKGPDLMQSFQKQAENFGTEIIYDEITSINFSEKEKTIKTYGAEYSAPAVIIATGADYKKLGVPGEEEYIGKGISFCATCDGAFFKDKEIVVIGGGDTALDEALYLTNFASKITIIHRRSMFRATSIIQERVKNNAKIQTKMNSAVVEITGDTFVKSVKIKNLKTNEVEDFSTSGVFIFVGLVPNTSLFKETIELDNNGYIVTDADMRTSLPGVFAAGDCRAKSLRQVITAAGDGAVAAYSARNYINEVKGVVYK